MYVCMYVRTYVYTVHTHVHMYIRMYLNTYVRRYVIVHAYVISEFLWFVVVKTAGTVVGSEQGEVARSGHIG